MAPVVHIVRHAEGYHNASKGGEGIHDPLLTEKGIQQCEQICKDFPYHDQIELLVASPLKRTIQTCHTCFKPVVDRGQKILLMPHAQESSDEPMDTGSTDQELLDTFGDLIDLSHLKDHPYWNRNVGQFDITPEAQIERAKKLREFLRHREEKHVVLVTHGSFAHFIAGNVDIEGHQMTRMWSNTEWRSYKFEETDAHEDARLIDLQESIDRRPDLEKEGDAKKHIWSLQGAKRGSLGVVDAGAIAAAAS